MPEQVCNIPWVLRLNNPKACGYKYRTCYLDKIMHCAAALLLPCGTPTHTYLTSTSIMDQVFAWQPGRLMNAAR